MNERFWSFACLISGVNLLTVQGGTWITAAGVTLICLSHELQDWAREKAFQKAQRRLMDQVTPLFQALNRNRAKEEEWPTEV